MLTIYAHSNVKIFIFHVSALKKSYMIDIQGIDHVTFALERKCEKWKILYACTYTYIQKFSLFTFSPQRKRYIIDTQN